MVGRVSAVLLVVVVGCDPAPLPGFGHPTPLPGLSPPLCETERTAYVLDRLSRPSGLGIRATFDHSGLLTNVFNQAVTSGNLTWALVLDRCDDDVEYRVTTAQARLVDPPLAALPTIELLSEGVASVGEIVFGDPVVSDGVGPVPLLALLDLRAAMAEPVWSEAMGITVRLEIGEDAIGGDLTFAFEYAQVVDETAELLVRTANAVIGADPGCPTACEEQATRFLLNFYDENGDGGLTSSEVVWGDWAPMIGRSPNIDLLATYDGVETYWPDIAGEQESLSFTTGFHARRALLLP